MSVLSSGLSSLLTLCVLLRLLLRLRSDLFPISLLLRRLRCLYRLRRLPRRLSLLLLLIPRCLSLCSGSVVLAISTAPGEEQSSDED